MFDKNKKIGEKIKEIRKSKNLSQDRFGRKLGLTGKTISAYETGRATPSLKVLQNIANTFDTPIFYIKDSKIEAIQLQFDQIKTSLSQLEFYLEND